MWAFRVRDPGTRGDRCLRSNTEKWARASGVDRLGSTLLQPGHLGDLAQFLSVIQFPCQPRRIQVTPPSLGCWEDERKFRKETRQVLTISNCHYLDDASGGFWYEAWLRSRSGGWIIKLREVSQTQKDIYHMISLIGGIWKTGTNELTYKTEVEAQM